MIRPSLALLSATLLAGPLSAQVAALPGEPDPIEAGMDSPAARYLDDGVDVLHYDIEIALPRGAGIIEGRTSIEVARDGEAAEVVFDFTGLRVDEVHLGGAPATGWTHADGLLAVPLPGGERHTVTIAYSGTPDDGLILGETVHGEPSAFVDNWPNRTRFWMPSVDHPSDKATARFTIHAPAEWMVVANGALVGSPSATPPEVPGPEVGERRTWVYETSVAHPSYTLVVGGAEMVVDTVGLAACGSAPASERADGCVAVTTWLFPESAEAGAPSFRRAAEMVDYFTELVGEYPYEKLANVQSATRFGGMENSSAIFYSQGALAAGANIEGTVSHEIAHQWFGDSVTEAAWSHLWLSEGFATYFGALFFEQADGPEAMRASMMSAANAYLASGDTARPVIDDRTDLFGLLNRNSYQKGGLVLHMLRRELGDADFFEGVRRYYARHRDGTALTADLQAVMEEVSGRSLGTFFEQWLRQPGYPVIEVATSASANGLRVALTQVQGDYAPRFEIPVDVQVVWDGGTVRRTVPLDGTGAEIVIEGAPADARVVLDPDGWLLHRRVDAG